MTAHVVTCSSPGTPTIQTDPDGWAIRFIRRRPNRRIARMPANTPGGALLACSRALHDFFVIRKPHGATITRSQWRASAVILPLPPRSPQRSCKLTVQQAPRRRSDRADQDISESNVQPATTKSAITLVGLLRPGGPIHRGDESGPGQEPLPPHPCSFFLHICNSITRPREPIEL